MVANICIHARGKVNVYLRSFSAVTNELSGEDRGSFGESIKVYELQNYTKVSGWRTV